MHELSLGDPRLELQSVLLAVTPRPSTSAALAFALAALAPVLQAQPNGAAGLRGSAALGTRSLDVDGTEAKFLEELNLGTGMRLFDLHLRYEPPTAEQASLDSLELDADGLGGEPFQSVHFGVRKYGTYRLALDRRRSEYFYDDTILPASLASVPASTGGDYHRLDFERIRDTAKLDIELSPATQLSLGLERQTRSGDSTTTMTVERDEFDIDRPLDESLDGLTFGVRHSWRRVSVIFAEELRDFENTSELLLPGASPGRNLADAAALSFFMSEQSYDYASRGHSVRVLASPTARLAVTALWRREDLDVDLSTSEHVGGTTFAGASFATALAGPGAINRDSEVHEVELGFAVTERVRVVGAARRMTLDQTGDGAFGAVAASAWSIVTDGFEAGVELALAPSLTLTAGWSTEERDADYAWSLEAAATARASTTQRDGYFADLDFATDGGWQLAASVEDNAFDAPYALASPTDSRRYKFAAKRQWQNGLSLTASYRNTDVENDGSRWIADTKQGDLRIAYRRDRLQVSAGYTRIALARSVDQVVTAGTRSLLFVIDYETAAMLRDASARWQINQRFAVGGTARSYDAHGSVRLTHDDLKVYGEIAVGSDYAVEVAVRDLDYAEDAFDAYDAEILEVALHVRW
jgi:hypothetical protein